MVDALYVVQKMRLHLLAFSIIILSCERQSKHEEPTIIDPNPNFKKTFGSANKLEFTYLHADPPVPAIILEDKADIKNFLDCIVFETHKEDEIVVCMCAGNPVVNVTLEDGRIESFVLHHGSRIRWKAYESDLHMTYDSASKFKIILDRHGIESD